MIRVGVIGYGYWGPNLVRVHNDLPSTRVVGVSDFREERLALVKKRFPAVKTTRDPLELIRASDVDAVAIATPVATHFELALEALRCGKHVLVEKPMTATSEQAERLIEEAEKRNLVLMVDHTFVYTGAVRKIKELVAGDQLGDIYYYDSVRVNLGLIRHDVNVIWDLAVHDLTIMDFVLSSRPVAVSATGVQHFPGQPEDVAFLSIFFPGNLIGHVHVNWLAPVKVRRTLIGGSQKMVVYDDLEPFEPVRVYDKGIMLNGTDENIHKLRIDYRTGDMWAPKVDVTEALQTEALHFVECIMHRKHPITDGVAGLHVIRLLEAATRSLVARGAPVELKP